MAAFRGSRFSSESVLGVAAEAFELDSVDSFTEDLGAIFSKSDLLNQTFVVEEFKTQMKHSLEEFEISAATLERRSW